MSPVDPPSSKTLLKWLEEEKEWLREGQNARLKCQHSWPYLAKTVAKLLSAPS